MSLKALDPWDESIDKVVLSLCQEFRTMTPPLSQIYPFYWWATTRFSSVANENPLFSYRTYHPNDELISKDSWLSVFKRLETDPFREVITLKVHFEPLTARSVPKAYTHIEHLAVLGVYADLPVLSVRRKLPDQERNQYELRLRYQLPRTAAFFNGTRKVSNYLDHLKERYCQWAEKVFFH